MFRFLVNPAAGGGRARRYLSRIRARAAALGAELHVSCSGPDLADQASRAAAAGAERLIIAGGDGSMHLAVQGLAGSDCALAVLPCGRGDDLARSIGVPARFEDALELATAGVPRPIDLGRSGDRWFVLYCGAGFDSACSVTADRQPRWWPDKLTYIAAVFRTVVGFEPPRARVEWQGGSYDGDVMFVTACNAPRFGGGMYIAPAAEMDDGQLDLVVIRSMSKLHLLLRVFPKVFKGRHVGHPAVAIHRTPWARVSFDSEQVVGCDGELIGRVQREPLELSIVPGALRVVAGGAGRDQSREVTRVTGVPDRSAQHRRGG